VSPRQVALLAAAALALTLVVTWPLAACFGRCLGEPPDTLLSVYFLAWVAHAVLTPGTRVLDASFFAPYTGTLALGDYMPGYAGVSVPVIAATGNPVTAHNVLLVASYTLAAVGATLLAARLVGRLGPAVVAGVAFGYAPRLLDEAYNVQTLAVFWFPWLLLALDAVLARPTAWRAALAAGLWVALAASSLNVFVYATVLAGCFVAAAVTLGGRRLGRAHAVPLAAAGGVAVAVLVWGVLAPNRALVREWGLTRDLAEVERHSATLADLVTVPRERLLRHLAGLDAGPDHTGLGPGLVVLALALVGLVALARNWEGRRPILWPYAVVWASALVLALGPTLQTSWGPLPLPYRILYHGVPGFNASRTPLRFLVFVELGLALLAALGAAWWLASRPPSQRPWLVAALAGLVLVESVAVPYPGTRHRLDPAAVPAVYRWLATQPPRTIALGIPLGDWVNIAAGTFHLRRTLNGWSSYLPPHYAEMASAMERFPDARSLALAQGAGVDVVLVDRAWLTPARVTALAGAAGVLRPDRVFPTHLVYRLQPAPGGLAGVEVASWSVPGRHCVRLGNPGPGWVPLYPLHRLHVRAEGARDGVVRWLPVDLEPGAAHTACVTVPDVRPGDRLAGEVENGARAYRFTVVPDGPGGRLEAAR
jgi:hypothetical protein